MLSHVADKDHLPSSSNIKDEGRLDVRASSFWIIVQKAFFDLRIFALSALRYQFRANKPHLALNIRGNKRKYNIRILKTEQGRFTPLVFTKQGAMENECKRFISNLSKLLSIKTNIPRSIVVSWVQMKIKFGQITSMLICWR